MVTIPKTIGKFVQNNRSDSSLYGDLWASFGIDLQSNLGAMRLTQRLRTLTTAVSGCPIGFDKFLSKYWMVAGTKVYNNGVAGGLANSAFAEDATSGTPTTCDPDYSDIKFFNTRIWVSTPALLKSCTTVPAWNTQLTFGSSAVPHPLCYFEKLNRLYFVDDYGKIGSVSAAYVSNVTGDYSIGTDTPLPEPTATITCIDKTSASLWFGTNAVNTSRKALVYKWNGLTATPDAIYELKATACVAIKVENDIPYVMDSDGRWLKFNGSGFQEVDRLPCTVPLVNSCGLLNNRFIHPNGIAVTNDGTFLFSINGANNDAGTSTIATQNENMPSGIWEWSPDSGFVHRQSYTYNAYGSTTITDWGQFRILRAGGLLLADDGSASGLQTLMAGASYYTDASTTTSSVFIEDTLDILQKAGYFISTKINSNELEDAINTAFIFHRQFANSTDKMVVKYKVTDNTFTEKQITWTSTTQFTAIGLSAFAKGDEVHIVCGVGGGMVSHITAITQVSGLYTVTIEDTVTGATGSALARFQKWRKAGKVNDPNDYDQIPLGATTRMIELKMFLLFTGVNEFTYAKLVNSVEKETQ